MAGQNQQSYLCAQQRLGSAWASTQSDQSLHCPQEESWDPWLPTEGTAKTYHSGRMPLLIWAFSGRTGHFVGFVVHRLKSKHTSSRFLVHSYSVISWDTEQSKVLIIWYSLGVVWYWHKVKTGHKYTVYLFHIVEFLKRKQRSIQDTVKFKNNQDTQSNCSNYCYPKIWKL